jgi:ABC-2 type transport system permease protein
VETLIIFMNTIYILWLRQIKRYMRSRSRIIGSLGQPILFLFALGFGFGPTFAKAGEGSYIQFLAPGIIAMSVLFSSIFTGIEIIWDRQFGFLKETLVAPVSRINIMIGRTLGGATIAVLQGLIVYGISMIAGFKPVHIYGVFLAFIILFITAVIFTAIGTAIASVLDDIHGFQLIMNFMVMPLFFLSGALFPLQNLSGIIESITNLNPMSYSVDGLRGSLVGISHFGLPVDFLVLTTMMVVLLGIGGYLFSKIEL